MANIKLIFTYLNKALKLLFLVPVYFYRYFISPFTPSSCRHVPTCSEYAIKAVQNHGIFVGTWLATKRISHCHPWGTSGYDPVPPRKIKVKRIKL
jgi:putative membrane protein insertion efficiency factor